MGKYTYDVEVTRTRTIIDTTIVEIESTKKLTEEQVFEMAKKQLEEEEADRDWDEYDSSEGDYEFDILEGDLKEEA